MEMKFSKIHISRNILQYLFEDLIRIGEMSISVAKDLDTNHPIALISCKLSLHGRFSETLFYSKIYREKIPDLKVVFATPDKGRQNKPGIWKSEWGILSKIPQKIEHSQKLIFTVFISTMNIG